MKAKDLIATLYCLLESVLINDLTKLPKVRYGNKKRIDGYKDGFQTGYRALQTLQNLKIKSLMEKLRPKN